MSIGVRIEANTAALKRILASLPKAVREEMGDQNRESAEAMAAHLRRIAPRKSGAMVSSVKVTYDDPSATVWMGGEKTTKSFRRGTSYARDVVIGSGDTKGIAKGGTGSLKFDYTRGFEFGYQQRGGGKKQDPSFVPARRVAVKKHRRAMGRRLKKVLDTRSSK